MPIISNPALRLCLAPRLVSFLPQSFSPALIIPSRLRADWRAPLKATGCQPPWSLDRFSLSPSLSLSFSLSLQPSPLSSPVLASLEAYLCPVLAPVSQCRPPPLDCSGRVIARAIHDWSNRDGRAGKCFGTMRLDQIPNVVSRPIPPLRPLPQSRPSHARSISPAVGHAAMNSPLPLRLRFT